MGNPATTTGTERVLLVSGDSHVGPHLDAAIRDYCPPEHLEAYDEASNSPIVARTRTMFTSMPSPHLKTKGHDDPDARLADMDHDGIAAEVIFHGSFNGEPMPFQDGGWPTPNEPELTAVGYRMYNRWLADFCSVAPERLIGLVQIPMWDVDTAVDEVQWAADHGFRGINFPASRLGWSQYDDPSWEPLWSVAEETGMVLTTHAGGNIDPAVMQRIGTPLFVLEAAGPMNRRSIPRMIIGGVFERHPGLKLAMTEQPGTWIPQLLTEMDSATLAHPARDGKPLPKLPSEYFATNVFVGASFMAPFEAEAALADGTWRNMFWGRDYPHPEGTWTFDEAGDSVPLTYLSLRHAFAGDLPEHEVRAMVGTNAVEIYGLDGDALRAVADKIGPTYEEITTPLDDIPDLDGPVRQGMGRFAFRTMGAWA